MTRGDLRAGSDLLPTWVVQQKAEANRRVIAVIRQRLAAGAGRHAARPGRRYRGEASIKPDGEKSPAGPAAAPGHFGGPLGHEPAEAPRSLPKAEATSADRAACPWNASGGSSAARTRPGGFTASRLTSG